MIEAIFSQRACPWDRNRPGRVEKREGAGLSRIQHNHIGEGDSAALLKPPMDSFAPYNKTARNRQKCLFKVKNPSGVKQGEKEWEGTREGASSFHFWWKGSARHAVKVTSEIKTPGRVKVKVLINPSVEMICEKGFGTTDANREKGDSLWEEEDQCSTLKLRMSGRVRR